MVEGVGKVRESLNQVPDGAGVGTGAGELQQKGQNANQERGLFQRKPQEQHVGKSDVCGSNGHRSSGVDIPIFAPLQQRMLQKQLLTGLQQVCGA
jgi:hypothetical protein